MYKHICSGNFSPGILPYISSEIEAKDNRSSFQEYLQATFLEHRNSYTSPVGLLEQAKVISRSPNKHLYIILLWDAEAHTFRLFQISVDTFS